MTPKLIADGYTPAQFQNYRKLYFDIFKRNAATCGCASQQVYNEINNYYENLKKNEQAKQ
jgi:hypothetical protein